MIAATSFALGMMATGLRSLFAYIVVSLFILVVFGLSVLTTGSHAPFLDLGLAILSFNLGIGVAAMAMATGMRLLRPRSIH